MWQWWMWYGLDAKHIQHSDVRQCSSKLLLHALLASEGIQLTQCQRLWPWQRYWPKRIHHNHLQALLGQWSQLLCAGLPLLDCISLVHLDKAPVRLRYELILLKNALLKGTGFSQALAQSGVFSNTLVQLVAAGEASGELGELLTKIHHQQAQQLTLKRRFLRSLFMPLVTLCSGLMVSLLIIYWVVPQVAELYVIGQSELPMITQWILILSVQAQTHFFNITMLLVLTYALFVGLWSWSLTRPRLEVLLWRMPGIGRLMYLHSQAELFLVLSITLNAGIPLLDGLKLAANSSAWREVSQSLNNAAAQLHQGQRLSQVILHMAWQPQALQLIRVGEATGSLGLSFSQLHRYYEVQVVDQSLWLEQLLEPALLIFVAVFVGFILVALYLPLFEMGQMM
ncbi:MAG: type II secretion system F family protein [Gammaproteobacteria bacterium]|nr:type II secretion system F family protein [Gammaproteobacteria bacterium]